VIDTLLVLVKNARTVVDKEMILETVWPGVIVEEGGLKRNISLLRKALGEEGHFIETLPKRGYRFAADVKQSWEEIPSHTVEDAGVEMLVERRTNLRFTREEVTSDSIDPQVECFSGATDSRAAPAVQRGLVSTLRRHSLPLLAGSVVALVAAVGLLSLVGRPDGTATPVAIKSLAVLPFKNLAAQGENTHFAIGLADVLITRLSNIKDLNVRPTNAVMKFNNKEQDSILAGQALGVDAVLEGSIYRVGDRVRVTARLVRVSDQLPIWTGQFDEKTDDFLTMQNTIAQQVVSSIALNLSRGEKDALTKRYTQSADAYQFYVTGRYHWNKRSGDGLAQAESFFRKALEKDPDFALAYVGLADSLTIRGIYHESAAAIEKAIELDDSLGELYASRGFWKMFKMWEWGDAEADFKRAVELTPGYGTAHQWYATLLAITGRVEEAKAEMKRALEIDPTSHNFLADTGQMYYFAREYHVAEDYCLKALEVYPDFGFARRYLADIYREKGEVDKAFEEEMKEIRSNYNLITDSEKVIARGEAIAREEYRKSGFKALWRAQISDLLNRRTDLFSYYGLVKNYTLLGEKEKALDCLEKSYENRDFMLPFVNIDPMYEGLRAEPRFQAVIHRMGLARWIEKRP
jgi:TolB-like protein/Tfp pilus assembly protein PilF